MRKNKIEKRHFYEIETCRNKEDVMCLAAEGQMLEKPEDIFKDLYILEFTELVTYSETELKKNIFEWI